MRSVHQSEILPVEKYFQMSRPLENLNIQMFI